MSTVLGLPSAFRPFLVSQLIASAHRDNSQSDVFGTTADCGGQLPSVISGIPMRDTASIRLYSRQELVATWPF